MAVNETQSRKQKGFKSRNSLHNHPKKCQVRSPASGWILTDTKLSCPRSDLKEVEIGMKLKSSWLQYPHSFHYFLLLGWINLFKVYLLCSRGLHRQWTRKWVNKVLRAKAYDCLKGGPI